MNLTISKSVHTDITSFGGTTLSDNLHRAELVVAETSHLQRIWNKSRSQFSLKYLTCSQASPYGRMRQIAAELDKKREALLEAKFTYEKRIAEAEVIKDERIPLHRSPKKRLMEIKENELRSQATFLLVKVEGALKEVLLLGQMYDQLKEVVGDVTEEDMEKAEVGSHIKRAVIQSLREIRECGTIRTGNQEYLEQIGLCVWAARTDMNKYLSQEESSGVQNTTMLHDFLDKMVEKYSQVAIVQAGLLGFSAESEKQIMWQDNTGV